MMRQACCILCNLTTTKRREGPVFLSWTMSVMVSLFYSLSKIISNGTYHHRCCGGIKATFASKAVLQQLRFLFGNAPTMWKVPRSGAECQSSWPSNNITRPTADKAHEATKLSKASSPWSKEGAPWQELGYHCAVGEYFVQVNRS